MPSSFARYLTFVLLAVAFTLPYLVPNHTYPIPTFYAEFSALTAYLLLGVAVLLLVRSAQPAVPFASPRVAWVPIGFGLLLVVQTFVLRLAMPAMNWLGFGFLLAAFMATQAGYGIARTQQVSVAMRWIAFALIVGGLLSVAAQVVQLFHMEKKFTPFVVAYNFTVERRPFGNMAQANHMATYIAFGVAGALFLAQTRRLNVLVWALVSAIFSGGLALTVSRGPWLQIAVIVVAGFWTALIGASRDDGRVHRHARANRRDVRAWLLPVALVVLFVAVNAFVRWANVHYGWQLDQSAAERFKDAGQIAPRLALWRYGLTMFRSHPLLGVGWGDFPIHQYELAKALGGVEIANNAHDVVIDLLAKTGIVGLAIVLLGLLAWFVRAALAPQAPERVFGFALIGALLMHALVEYPQQYMFFLLPAMFLFGLLDTRPLKFVPPGVSLGAYAVLVFGGLVSLYPVLRDYNRSEVLYYGSHPYEQYGKAPSYVFAPWGDYGMATLMPMTADHLGVKLAAHERALALLPGETVLRRYAVLQALDGNTTGALDTMDRLKIFATELHDWPTQLSAVYGLVDEHRSLAAFRATLQKRYGPAPAASDDDDDDGASD